MSNKGKYIVRQPIKNTEGLIIGYEILYCGENHTLSADHETANELAAANTIYNFLTQNTSKALKGSLNFMTFTTTLLMKKTPRLFDKSELVIQIDDSVIVHPLSMHFVHQYAKEGYQIAVNEFQFTPRYLALIDSIDYIKINIANPGAHMDALGNIVEIAQSMGKKCILTHIETEEQYQLAVSMNVDALEGPYVAAKLETKAHSSKYLRSNFFRLMVAITKDEPEVEEIEQLISVDAGLSFGLLKMANSAYFALRHRATTINQAIMTLGLGQLRQWVYLLSASSANQQTDAATEEFLKLSLMRANFCSELIQYAKNIPISESEGYLLGMFSTLHLLIDAPLQEILQDVPVADEIKSALLKQRGRCGLLYKLVISYEAAEWDEIDALSTELGISGELLTNVYFTCMEKVNDLWEQLTHISPNQVEQEEAT